eukprot:TRINITY_DN7683_c0_g1_i1.p1 TRINITY_DN7683_c0_g1~~TRINITY_DN7683_c0_g1_i1.p1  ORF type:complete len:352 (-),score=90.75 TRINITY_DN7683_c0_g1_i1:490-1545(-)
MGIHQEVTLDDYDEKKEQTVALPEEAPEEFKALDFKNHLHIKTEGILFWSKENVNGQVFYFNKEPVDVKRFSIKLKCIHRVRWSQGQNDHYSATRIPYQHVVEFLGEKTRLEAGYHVFPFTFRLDADKNVGSMEVVGGSVRWFLKAKVEKPGLSFNQRRRKVIRVIGDALNINYPTLAEEMKPKMGFGHVPVLASLRVHNNQVQDKITVTLKIENISEKDLYGFKLKVKRHICLKVPNRNATHWLRLIDLSKHNSKDKISPKEVVEKEITLNIPSNTIPSVRSELIDVFHKVYLRVLKPAFRFDLRLDLGINVKPPPKVLPSVQIEALPAQPPVPPSNPDVKEGKMEIDLM